MRRPTSQELLSRLEAHPGCARLDARLPQWREQEAASLAALAAALELPLDTASQALVLPARLGLYRLLLTAPFAGRHTGLLSGRLPISATAATTTERRLLIDYVYLPRWEYVDPLSQRCVVPAEGLLSLAARVAPYSAGRDADQEAPAIGQPTGLLGEGQTFSLALVAELLALLDGECRERDEALRRQLGLPTVRAAALADSLRLHYG